MPNHVHLVATPKREDALNFAVGRTHFIYTQYINRLHGRSGHLWQGRFHSCPMDDEHAVRAMRYIERNPVRAKLTRVPWTYPWSSATAHIEPIGDCAKRPKRGGNGPAPLLDLKAWNGLVPGIDWKEMLTHADDEETLATLRLNTQTGRPLASDLVLTKLERALGRRLRPLPVGRPRKEGRK